MNQNNIRHVFFDLDHTLWDFEKNSALTFQKIFELNEVQLEIDEFLQTYIPINFNYWKLYREEKIDKPKLRYGRLKDTFTSMKYDSDDVLIEKLSNDYIEHLTTFNHLFDGTRELLDYLKPKYTLHIITNGFEEAQLRKMTNSQLTNYFKTITNSEMVGVKKPNPRIFEFALEKANARREESVMIGDSLEADIMGASAVGMQTVFFNCHKENVPTDLITVDKLTEIKNYL